MTGYEAVEQADMTEFQQSEPDSACINYDRCGNEVPGAGKICPDCLDEARHSETSS